MQTVSRFDPGRIAEPGFFSEGCLPARADHRWYASKEDAAGTGRERRARGKHAIARFHAVLRQAEDGGV